MSCTTCSKASTIPTCCDELTIGAIGLNNTDLFVYFKKLSTNRLQRLEATSGAAGVVTVDLSPIQEYFHSSSAYEVWITTQDAEGIFDYETITIGADTEIECVILTFEKVQSTTYTAQTIALL